MKKKSFFILFILIVLVDQIIKIIVANLIPFGGTTKVIGDIIKLTHVRNTGGAFSLGENNIVIMIILNIVIIVGLLMYFIKKFDKLTYIIKISFTLIISGGTGNLLDRIFRGHVLDYIDINNLFTYPIFNFADILIVIGIILMIICIIKDSIRKQENV